MPTVTQTLDTLPPLDEERIAKIKNIEDKDIDLSDMPALSQEQLARFVPAKLHKPVKVSVKINYDADVLEWFRSFGKGYQTRMNAALREYMLSH
ncbi:hypothetical protein FACS1894172_19990 [Spirochaetia bacterium]|nr:hypothetical protein FACS1894172_19990 [Spirochaetia bacterium]